MKSLHSKDGTTCDHTEQQLKAALHVVGRRSHPAAPNCAHNSTLSTTSNGALDCLQNTQTSCAAATHSSNTQQQQQRRAARAAAELAVHARARAAAEPERHTSPTSTPPHHTPMHNIHPCTAEYMMHPGL
jgi:hypothetical protein